MLTQPFSVQRMSRIVTRTIRDWRALIGNPRRVASLPGNMRVYAVGDIHGRADLLRQLHHLIIDDAADLGKDSHRVVVYLGDYVDRSLHSRDVIATLLGEPPIGFETIHLMGNHERMLLDFLEDPLAGRDWLEFGGYATLLSYGVTLDEHPGASDRLMAASADLRHALSPRHLEFLRSLRLSWEIGDYFFVHAGIRPAVPLVEQSPEDLLWIRNEFRRSRANHEKLIVHGHSATSEPESLRNRIGVDTGAYATNRLSCVVLEADQRRFLVTETGQGKN